MTLTFKGIRFEPRDLWVGVYWTLEKQNEVGRFYAIYICVLPMLPLILDLYIDTRSKNG